MVGADHTAAPAGPYSCVPTEFFFVGRGFSGIVYIFQACSPVVASYATRDPRKVQHSYFGFGPDPSSNDATGT